MIDYYRRRIAETKRIAQTFAPGTYLEANAKLCIAWYEMALEFWRSLLPVWHGLKRLWSLLKALCGCGMAVVLFVVFVVLDRFIGIQTEGEQWYE